MALNTDYNKDFTVDSIKLPSEMKQMCPFLIGDKSMMTNSFNGILDVDNTNEDFILTGEFLKHKVVSTVKQYSDGLPVVDVARLGTDTVIGIYYNVSQLKQAKHKTNLNVMGTYNEFSEFGSSANIVIKDIKEKFVELRTIVGAVDINDQLQIHTDGVSLTKKTSGVAIARSLSYLSASGVGKVEYGI